MERGRQVAAAIVGILVIVILILLARWTGDRIKDKFLTPKQPTAVNQPVKPVLPVEPVASASTVSAIPATGPNDWAYISLATMAIFGLRFLRLAERPPAPH